MATGYTQAELDALLAAMDGLVPPVPTAKDRARARRVAAVRATGTDRGILVNIETKGGEPQLFWLNCWVAKELAAAINFAAQTYSWSTQGFKPTSSDHLRAPEKEDMKGAAKVFSLSMCGSSGGMLMRFAIGRPPKDRAMFFQPNAALEITKYVARGAVEAAWWDKEFELIPIRNSQYQP
jgi:hypothetical protein